MKTKSNTIRYLFATAVFGVLASFAHAGPPPEGWNRTKEIKTFTEAKALGSDAVVAIACDKCKTSLIRETRHVGPHGKGPDPIFTIGSKHTCDECGGEITVVNGKATDSMQMNCSKCGEGKVHCTATMSKMK
jgi:hypothetical protein